MKITDLRDAACRKPTSHRCLLMFVAVFLMTLPSFRGANAQQVELSEPDAVRRALALPAWSDVVERDAALARAAAMEARQWPNPAIEYSREDAGGSVEDIVTLSQELSLSGSRGLLATAAARRVDAAEARRERRHADRAAAVRHAFLGGSAAQRRLQAAEEWARQLESAVEVVARREAAGDVSAYDKLRVERELRAAEARVALASSAVATEWASLAAMTGIDAADPSELMLVGEPLPTTPLPPLEVVLARVDERGDLRAAEVDAHAADLERSAAARGWIPSITVGGGTKRVDAGGTSDTGYVVAASLPLPLFRREEPRRLAAEAEARAARGEHALQRAALRMRVRGLWQNASRLAAAAQRFADGRDDPGDLVRTAEAAYRGGEIGVLELVDAYRSRYESRLSQLELLVAARRARIELDAAVGGTNEP